MNYEPDFKWVLTTSQNLLIAMLYHLTLGMIHMLLMQGLNVLSRPHTSIGD